MNLFAGQAKSDGEPYLRVVGSPPLRFEVQAVESPLIMGELALPKPKGIEAPALPEAPAASQGTGSAVVNMAGNPTGIFGSPANNSASGANPASDMLNVNPQMITQYLKPNRSESHDGGAPSPFQPGQSILVPAELGFVPPMPGGNRAIYISK